MGHQYKFDVVIVGCGAAGLSAALLLPTSFSIAILAKTSNEQYSSYFAQGGISAVLEPDDSIEQHTRDTIEAGSGLCDESVVTATATAGRECIEWLSTLGMPFTRDRQEVSSSGYHLTREADTASVALYMPPMQLARHCNKPCRPIFWSEAISKFSTSMWRST